MSALSVEDIRLLEKTINIRERMIDNLLKAELPTKARDIDSFTNLLESVDRSIIQKAKISIEENTNKINEETKAVLTDLLLGMHKGEINQLNMSQETLNNREPPKYVPTGIDINPGTLIPGSDVVSMSDIKRD